MHGAGALERAPSALCHARVARACGTAAALAVGCRASGGALGKGEEGCGSGCLGRACVGVEADQGRVQEGCCAAFLRDSCRSVAAVARKVALMFLCESLLFKVWCRASVRSEESLNQLPVGSQGYRFVEAVVNLGVEMDPLQDQQTFPAPHPHIHVTDPCFRTPDCLTHPFDHMPVLPSSGSKVQNVLEALCASCVFASIDCAWLC